MDITDSVGLIVKKEEEIIDLIITKEQGVIKWWTYGVVSI